MMKVMMKASAYVLLIGLFVCGPLLGFASAQDEPERKNYDGCAEDVDCPCSGLWCEWGCDSGCTGECAPERKNFDGCAEDADCSCSGLWCQWGCDMGCTGDCKGDAGDAYTGCADMCCINDTDCKHDCPNHAYCDCPEDSDDDSSDPGDNNEKYPIDTTVPWWRPPAERTESGDLNLRFIYTGELDDLWVWRSDDGGEVWVPYWNTVGSGTANGRITVVSQRAEGDDLYVTIPDAAAEFPEETLLVFETQHPEIVCVMYINLKLEYGWVDTLGKGGDRTGVDKFPRPPAGGGSDGNGDGGDDDGDGTPPAIVPNTPPAHVPNTGGEIPADGTNSGANTGTEPPSATDPNTNIGRPAGPGTTTGNQRPFVSHLKLAGRAVGSTKSGRGSTHTVVVSGNHEGIDPATESEPNAPDSSTVSDGYPSTSTSDIVPDTIPKAEPSAEDNATPSPWSNRVFTAMVAIGIAAALLVGAAIWVKRRKLRSR